MKKKGRRKRERMKEGKKEGKERGQVIKMEIFSSILESFFH